MRGEENVVHRVEFELLASLIGDTQDVRRQSLWTIQVPYEEGDMAGARLKTRFSGLSRDCSKAALDAMGSEELRCDNMNIK